MRMVDMVRFDRLQRGRNIKQNFVYDTEECFRDMVFGSVMDNLNENYPGLSKRLEREYTYIPF